MVYARQIGRRLTWIGGCHDIYQSLFVECAKIRFHVRFLSLDHLGSVVGSRSLPKLYDTMRMLVDHKSLGRRRLGRQCPAWRKI
ncbi:hypothetical protein SETIT_7G097700v2 [Setaria italica]|uniref:Uncharacterized protein n=1 Tax=Setaria italica TaxID=4555 RepID=A0A368RVQ1_SETIT|nr:hypothetical protein SETIT_7G097700v2 [Setaria italica]